jgi:hypothetical protein
LIRPLSPPAIPTDSEVRAEAEREQIPGHRAHTLIDPDHPSSELRPYRRLLMTRAAALVPVPTGTAAAPSASASVVLCVYPSPCLSLVFHHSVRSSGMVIANAAAPGALPAPFRCQSRPAAGVNSIMMYLGRSLRLHDVSRSFAPAPLEPRARSSRHT